jgi:hypothetical protein
MTNSASWRQPCCARASETACYDLKRFLVTTEENNINGAKVLHDFASKLDTGKLAGLN